jgi:hypothetical protein
VRRQSAGAPHRVQQGLTPVPHIHDGYSTTIFVQMNYTGVR